MVLYKCSITITCLQSIHQWINLLSSLWVSCTGSASDWCALQEALYKCIDTIQYNQYTLDAASLQDACVWQGDSYWLMRIVFVPVCLVVPCSSLFQNVHLIVSGRSFVGWRRRTCTRSCSTVNCPDRRNRSSEPSRMARQPMQRSLNAFAGLFILSYINCCLRASRERLYVNVRLRLWLQCRHNTIIIQIKFSLQCIYNTITILL